MQLVQPTIKGRGAAENPPNRFERIHIEHNADACFAEDEEKAPPETIYLRDSSRTVIARNNSPDIPFEASLNPYRGCTHGCIYCYARPTHEYLGFSGGLDFETKILVKEDAPELLRKELSSRSWEPKTIAIGGVTDPYQPIERKLGITRRCLEVLAEFGNPATIVTKNHLVTRDIDILSPMAARNLTAVFVSITTLDPALTAIMEPRTATPKRRLAAVSALAGAGVPVGVMVAPVIPGLTDHEMSAILTAAAEAGATMAGFTFVRLPLGVADLFEEWLARHMPDRKDKVLNRIRAMKGGQLNRAAFGTRMHGDGPFAEHIQQMFDLSCRKLHLNERKLNLSKTEFRRKADSQMSLFQ